MTNAERPHRSLDALGVVALVARRELLTRLRSKVFLITTGIAALLVVAASLLATSISTDEGTDATIGVPAGAPTLPDQIAAVGASLGLNLDTEEVAGIEDGRAGVRDGDLDAFVMPDGERLSVIVESDLDPELESAFNVLAASTVLDREITDLGGDPAAVNRAISQAAVNLETLEDPRFDVERLILGMIAGILIYGSLLMHGQALAQGVVEEKSSRVIELLLSTIRPWQLMAGKVLGIGTLGLIQIAVIAGAGVISAVATDALTISFGSIAGTAAWLIVWYIVGFFGYALVLAAVSALVSRQEDINAVLTPVLMLIISGFVIGISVLPSDPDSAVIRVMSLIPTFAPMLMPMRLAIGGVPAWEALLALGLALAMIPLLIWVSGRVYRNAIMRTGSRMKLRDAFRAAS
ncbi:MAG: ABC transporter permease [Acidimicrobiia bacterium]|nr:ABC transporter permease [Acidimicrobiia bacterium]MBA3982113.1 ABC transporter permease [Acidimicrobiia bacterium]